MSALADAVFFHVFPQLAASRQEDGAGGRVPGAGGREHADDAVRSHATTNAADEPTVAALRAGDAATYAEVFRAHYGMLVGFAASFLDDRARAEEIVGDVFVWLYERRETLDVAGSLRGYLFAAVRHAALNARRGRHRELARYGRMRDEGIEGVAAVPMPSPDESLVAAESSAILRDAVARALDRLPSQARLVLALRLHRGLDYDEIAVALGVSRVAAKQRFSRAVAALRALLPELLE